MPDSTDPGDGTTVPAPSVVVLADDPLTRDGTHAFMAARGHVEVLARDRLRDADVAVLITPRITGQTLAALQDISRSTGGRARIVLITDRASAGQLAIAARHGVVTFLLRQHTSFTQMEKAALAAARGEPVPGTRATPDTSDAPAGLAPREIDVLRLLAEGRDVAEIAGELSYSERLIKSVIHSAVKRLGKRNRTQAVAHAIRTGIL